MSDPRTAVVLVTDYGADDSYAGSLVGALWTADPDARWAVGTHGVPPGDVLAGAYHVKALARSFPAGTVLCAVVDPGVGTDRRAIAVEADGVRCVAPDNGLCTWRWETSPARARSRRRGSGAAPGAWRAPTRTSAEGSPSSRAARGTSRSPPGTSPRWRAAVPPRGRACASPWARGDFGRHPGGALR